MKNDRYCVWFKYGGNIYVTAGSAKDAAILACAERINQARNIEIEIIENLDTKFMELPKGNWTLILVEN